MRFHHHVGPRAGPLRSRAWASSSSFWATPDGSCLWLGLWLGLWLLSCARLWDPVCRQVSQCLQVPLALRLMAWARRVLDLDGLAATCCVLFPLGLVPGWRWCQCTHCVILGSGGNKCWKRNSCWVSSSSCCGLRETLQDSARLCETLRDSAHTGKASMQVSQ